MILKLDQWLANAIGKEMKISHFDCDVFGGSSKSIKKKIRAKIEHEFSEKFLNDADYLLFFRGEALNDEDAIEKLASIVKRALGRASANDLAVADFKVCKAEKPVGTGDDDQEQEDAEAAGESIDFVFVKITIS